MKTKISIEKNILITFGIGLITAFAAFIYFIINGNGVFILRDDFNLQQIPFTQELHRQIMEGGMFGYDHNVDLGASAVTAYSFYELMSPFFWISMLFPAKYFPYAAGYIYMLKYACAAGFAYMYIKRFTGEKAAFCGALLYAFSGYQATNLLYYHFHDVVAFFPLLLLGLEIFMEDNKRYRTLIAAVVICIFVNYYFFIEECVFLLIYFVLRFGAGDYKNIFKRVGMLALYGAIGVGIAAFVFVPSVIYVFGGSRSESGINIHELLYSVQYMLYMLKGMLLPAEPMHLQSAVIEANWNSVGVYMPCVGLCLAVVYIIKNKDFLSRILVLLFIIAVSPVLSSGFLFFTEANQRWWFSLSMMLALASAKVIDEPEKYNIKKSGIIYFIIVMCFGVLLYKLPMNGKDSSVFDINKFLTVWGISLLGALVIVILAGIKKINAKNMLWAIMFFSVLTTFYTIHAYKEDTMSESDYMQYLNACMAIERFDDQYRMYNCNDNMVCMSGVNPGIGSFITTKSNSIEDLQDVFDYYSVSTGLDKNETEGLPELLGGRYKFTKRLREKDHLFQTIKEGDEEYYVVEKDACPIGFSAEHVIRRSQIEALPVEQRALALLEAVCIEDEDINSDICDLAAEVGAGTIELSEDAEAFMDGFDTDKRAVKDFVKDSRGFRCRTDYAKDTLVFFSIPYDKGFTAYLNGVETDIIYSAGMMAVIVPAGENTVDFVYKTPGLFVGAVISILSLIILVGIILRERKLKQNG